jgi:hypothetical protein
MAYTFANPERTMALRSVDNAFVPWNTNPVQPVDIDGQAGRTWKQEGSPIPDPYEPPPPSEDEIRAAQFNEDPDRQAIVTILQNKTPDQIKEWVNNNATDLVTIQQMLLQLMLLVAKTLRD